VSAHIKDERATATGANTVMAGFAELALVSRQTLSRVINDGKHARAGTRRSSGKPETLSFAAQGSFKP
jgi:hypothetical protein